MDIERNIKCDIDALEYKINNRDIINRRNFIIRGILKLGLTFDYVFPYILSTLIIFNVKSNKPFVIDEIQSYAKVKTIDSSLGVHREIKSYTEKFDDEVLEYSTGWFVNEDGLYERHVTKYKLNGEIDLNDLDSIFSMNKDDLDNLFSYKNSVVTKYSLDDDDYLYNDDVIVVVNHYKSNDDYIYRLETDKENWVYSFGWLISILMWGYNFSNWKYILVKSYVKDKINGYTIKYRKIDIKELDNLEKLLSVKKNNLDMLNNSNEYTLKLRK